MKLKTFEQFENLNESNLRDEVKSKMMSSFKSKGTVKDIEKVKSDILKLVDDMLDDEVELLNQIAMIESGELSKKDVDFKKITEFSIKFGKMLQDIAKKYN
jgi:hypothetical protein